MGRPKLLLPWPSAASPDRCLIEHVLQCWTSSLVAEVIVVIRRDDDALQAVCDGWPVHFVLPEEDPEDMKASVMAGLCFIEGRFQPSPRDGCFVAPADLPSLTTHLIDRLVQAPADESTIVVPSFGGATGHPARLPWALTPEIEELPDQEGVDSLVRRHQKLSVPFPGEDRVDDVDTPEEYEAARRKAKKT